MLSFALVLAAATPVVDHDLSVALDPAHGRADVVDTITLDRERSSIDLVLHAGMKPQVDGATVSVSTRPPGGAVPSENVHVALAKPARAIVVRYAGPIVHSPAQVATEHQRSFAETPGTIDARGVYLGKDALWYPELVVDGAPLDELVTSKVKVTALPATWRALSEGDGAGANAWISTTPADDIHLVAGPFSEAKERKLGVDVLIWLRLGDDGKPAPDSGALAQRYLEVTGQYLKLYKELIGPYPYAKFALVENFWETGYGFPSFTLLGPQVIRFPFILHTSWPHELLHNWWGNGVFVKGGNWSEGLTAYLADHLDAEQNGKGDEYRRTTLQRYQDFVSVDASKDFALARFTSRFSAASEAIGYGKWLLVVHMLRQKLGDDGFKHALQKLWTDHRFERASFDDVRAAFQPQTSEDLAPFFDAWINRTGAPRIRWRSIRDVKHKDGTHSVDVEIEQTQHDAAFPMEVPVVVTTVDGKGVRGVVAMRGGGDAAAHVARASIAIGNAAAARVDVDPFAETFRALLSGETAPSLSRSLGATKAVFVMPTLASPDERSAWSRFKDAVCADGASCSAVDDKNVTTLPSDAALWILGYGNALRGAAVASSSRFGANFSDVGFLSPGPWTRDRVKNERTDPGKTDVVLALANPRGGDFGAAFVGAHTAKSIDLLAKKVPHYGKYGYLAFSGDAVENSLKGTWEPDASPMTVFLGSARPKVALAQEPPIAKLPPPFDADRMVDVVKKLSAMNGRGNGTKDLDDALLVARLELQSASIAATGGKDGALVAAIEGKDQSLPHVVVSAHVDHLGKQGGKIYPGADDNASGVAVLLEVARELKKAGPFERTIDVVAFTGEELGLKGSRAFVKSLGDAKSKVMADVNLDCVGRRGQKPLLVLDGQSATEWVHIFRGVGFTTGVPVELAKEGGGASDQQAFLEAGVPAVQIFSGPNVDYHKPTDTPDKIEPQSLVDAAVVVREAVAYLADRKEPLSMGTAGPSATGTRKASLGTVPDMTFNGPGVKVDGTVPGSPAEKLGLKQGDVLVKFDGKVVDGLRGYSELLKAHAPGDKVHIVVVRDGKEMNFDATLVER
jgi:hypothetical protein